MFKSSQKLARFHAAHDVLEERMSQRLKLVRNLWIGAEPSNTKRRLGGDLTYASSAWPVTIITRILLMCSSLEHFTLLNLSQNDWEKLEHAIPASLKYLSMGPVHGPFQIANLPKKSQLQQFTSISTFMRDNEVQSLVLHPMLQTFRRLSEAIETDTLAKFAAEQVECVSKSTILKEYIIAICLRPGSLYDGYSFIDQVEIKLRENTEDPRVFVSTIPNQYWSDVIHEEYLSVRLGMFVSQA
ncbi:hypothetical protein H1R20_g325, partial [Candolleomyces eurysporus]